MKKTHDNMARIRKWATRKRQGRRKIKDPQENTTHNKIGQYARAENRKRKRDTNRKNMPNAPDDTDGNMGRAEKRKNRTHGKTQTARIYA